MIPGMNPRQMRQAMKKMGIQQQDIQAVQVVIRTADHDIIIDSPQVAKVNMMGQDTYQIVGEEVIQAREQEAPEISDDDLQTIVDQTGVSKEKAQEALESNDYDLAAAIISLSESE